MRGSVIVIGHGTGLKGRSSWALGDTFPCNLLHAVRPKGCLPRSQAPQVCPAQRKTREEQDPSFPRASLRSRQLAALCSAVGFVMAVFNPWPHQMMELQVLSPEGGGWGRGRVTH